MKISLVSGSNVVFYFGKPPADLGGANVGKRVGGRPTQTNLKGVRRGQRSIAWISVRRI